MNETDFLNKLLGEAKSLDQSFKNELDRRYGFLIKIISQLTTVKPDKKVLITGLYDIDGNVVTGIYVEKDGIFYFDGNTEIRIRDLSNLRKYLDDCEVKLGVLASEDGLIETVKNIVNEVREKRIRFLDLRKYEEDK